MQRNQKRRAALVGTEEDQTIPLQGAAKEAFLAVRSAAWEGVYLSEYMLFPRYPCLEMERVGMWGEGGKVSGYVKSLFIRPTSLLSELLRLSL